VLRDEELSYSEIAKILEVGPIAISDDRQEDFLYKVEVLREVGPPESYRLFLWRKDRYFVRRPLKNSEAVANNRQLNNPYHVEVRRDPGRASEIHLFDWDKQKFLKQLRENPEDWQEKLIEAKDNSLLWEEMIGPTVEAVLNQLTETLVADFPSLGGDVKSVRCRELVKTVDLEPISVEETNEYYRFRIEIMRAESPDKSYQASVYRFESYSLRPTFAPEAELASDVADCWLWVADEQELLGKIEAVTIEGVVEQALRARDDLAARLRCR
jgi:hypothetical protein